MTKANIFIIDDEKLDRYLLVRDLKKGGVDANIVEFRDGREAIDYLEQFDAHSEEGTNGFPPQIIFLDINMPRLSGFGFLDQFNSLQAKHKDYDQCAVMMMTSSERPEERERALDHGAVTEFLTKGKTSAEELGTKIREVLRPSGELDA